MALNLVHQNSYISETFIKVSEGDPAAYDSSYSYIVEVLAKVYQIY